MRGINGGKYIRCRSFLIIFIAQPLQHHLDYVVVQLELRGRFHLRCTPGGLPASKLPKKCKAVPGTRKFASCYVLYSWCANMFFLLQVLVVSIYNAAFRNA